MLQGIRVFWCQLSKWVEFVELRGLEDGVLSAEWSLAGPGAGNVLFSLRPSLVPGPLEALGGREMGGKGPML